MRDYSKATCSAFLGMFALILLAGPALADHETGHDEVARGGMLALEQRIWELEQTLLNLPVPGIRSVDCDLGELIQDAVDNAVEGDTVEVTGSCSETVNIDKDRIELIGMPNAAISGQVRVSGSDVTIRNFSDITNTLTSAVVVERSGSAIIDGNNISAENNAVVAFEGSHADVTNNILTSTLNGVGVANSSSALITGNVINGARIGVLLIRSSSADIVNNTITGASLGGLVSSRASSARVGGNTITGNSKGILVTQTSTVDLSPTIPSLGLDSPNTLQNTGEEVQCAGFSSMNVFVPQTFLDVAPVISVGTDCSLQGTLP